MGSVLNNLPLIPAGTKVPFAGATVPAGWLLCYGQAISRTTYGRLFAAIGTTWGAGDGSTTFNLPDLRGRVPLGKDNMGGTAAGRITSSSTGGSNSTNLGGSGGAETHTLTTAQLPDLGFGTGRLARAGSKGLGEGSGTGFEGGSCAVTPTNGGGSAHSNTQPWVATNWIIKI